MDFSINNDASHSIAISKDVDIEAQLSDLLGQNKLDGKSWFKSILAIFNVAGGLRLIFRWMGRWQSCIAK